MNLFGIIAHKKHIKRYFPAFTLVEILVSLTIIGIIAGFTIPAIIGNLNQNMWNTQRKALYSRLSNAFQSMSYTSGYFDNENGSSAFNFIQNGLAQEMNIKKICDIGQNNRCDFAPQVTTMTDELFLTGARVSFMTTNGESIGVEYNDTCIGTSEDDFLANNIGGLNNVVCINLIYDLNGASKGPNKVGKDIGFMSSIYPSYPTLVAPMPVAGSRYEVTTTEARKILRENEGTRYPNMLEAASIMRNKALISKAYDPVVPDPIREDKPKNRDVEFGGDGDGDDNGDDITGEEEDEDMINLWVSNLGMCSKSHCSREYEVPREYGVAIVIDKHGNAPKKYIIGKVHKPPQQ